MHKLSFCLIFTNLVEDRKNRVPDELAKNLWQPRRRIIHENAIIGSMQKDSSTDVEIKLSNKSNQKAMSEGSTNQLSSNNVEDKIFDGEAIQLIMKERYKIEYDCNFNLRKFPFDKQHCCLIIKMMTTNHSDRIQLVGDSPKSWFYDGPKTVYEFEVKNINEETMNVENETKFVIHIVLSRHYMNQILSTFFPTFLLWVLAYSTLLIDVDNFTDRIMVTVTSLLVLVSLLGPISEELPKTSYFMYIHLWFVFYVSDIFMITIYHITLGMVNNDKKQESHESTKIFWIASANTRHVLKEEQCTKSIRRKHINSCAMAIFLALTLTFNVIYFLFTTGTIRN